MSTNAELITENVICKLQKKLAFGTKLFFLTDLSMLSLTDVSRKYYRNKELTTSTHSVCLPNSPAAFPDVRRAWHRAFRRNRHLRKLGRNVFHLSGVMCFVRLGHREIATRQCALRRLTSESSVRLFSPRVREYHAESISCA